MKKVFWVTLFLFAASFLACTHTGGVSRPTAYSFTIDLPEGWRKIENNRYLFVTKENSFEQYIMVQNRPISRPFRSTKKKIRKGMLPEEAAQVIIDDLVSDQNLVNLRILKNTPANVKGNKGFKILFVHGDSQGRTFKTLYYGFIKADTFFNLRFSASNQALFQKDIQAFNFMLDSFQVVKAIKS